MSDSNWRVLVSAPYMIPVLSEYEELFRANKIEAVVAKVSERLSESELFQWLPDVDGVISGDDHFTQRVLQAFPRLKVISKWGTGIDSIDWEAAQRLGVRVYNTPGAFTDSVADSVMGYVLAFARRQPWMTADMRAGRWHKVPCVALRECVLGVIGVGGIGRAVVKRTMAFGMRTLGNDIREVPREFVAATGLEVVAKDELLERADFVSLNCDLNPTSYHLIGKQELRRMKPSAHLINTARGPIVEEAALVKALEERWIAGVALDVFEVEPLPVGSPLRVFENCLLAPHNANSSPEAALRVHENTIRNLLIGLEASRR